MLHGNRRRVSRASALKELEPRDPHASRRWPIPSSVKAAGWPSIRAAAYRWRRRGEYHQWNPDTIAKLQHAAKLNNRERLPGSLPKAVNERSRTPFHAFAASSSSRSGTPDPLRDEVEPASEIVKRFCTGRHVLWAPSAEEAHDHAGHRHEPPGRPQQHGRRRRGSRGASSPTRNGDLRRSAIKQVASGRFGVTNEYLVNSDETPDQDGPGRQARRRRPAPRDTRCSRRSPRSATRRPAWSLSLRRPTTTSTPSRIWHSLSTTSRTPTFYGKVSVKLVSEAGVGTIAAGVSKGKADLVLISGHDGGTGASPLSSVKHMRACPGNLASPRRTRCLWRTTLRDRIRVQVDGQLKTGRDVAIGALLGADEFGFATAPLIVDRLHHDAQVPSEHLSRRALPRRTRVPAQEVRRRKPEHVVNYLFFVAEECREIMAQLGVRTMNEMVGTGTESPQVRAAA